MQTHFLPKIFLAVFAIFFSTCSIDAQTVTVVPEANSQYDFETSGTPLWGYTGNPIVYNNQLYVQYQRVPYGLAQNNKVPMQLAQYSGNTLNLIANPDTTLNFVASGYVGNPIVFNNKLYINYQNKAGVNQLAAYNGGNALQLIANPDASLYGYQGSPIIYNNALYIVYTNAAGTNQLAKFDGITVTLIPNPDASRYGYQGNPIVFNGKLFVKYSVNIGNGPWTLASFDGTTWKVYPNPDASNYGYQGNQIIFNGKLYGRYASSITGKSQLMVYDGSSNPTLISNPDAGYGYNGFPIVNNNTLFIQYKNTLNVLQLATYKGSSISLIPNPDASSTGYQGTPIIYNNTLCIFYNSIAKVNRLAVYNGGDTLHLVPNPDASANGYWNFPIVYGANLYFQYYNAAGNFQLGNFNGTAIRLIPNPTNGFNGVVAYAGAPLVFNNLLYTLFNNEQYDQFANLAYFNESTLPVTLTNFNGVLQNGNALLTWSTATEINNKGFEIFRSVDGINFNSIGFVAGAGNSDLLLNYQFTDKPALSGNVFYRLKQVDMDAKFAWSNIVSVKLNNQTLITFIPNPAQNFITISSPVIVKEIRLLNAGGQLIKVWNSVSPNAQLSLSDIAKGIYMIQIINDKFIQTQKIVKQ
ncbi:MAG: T9SS type A sorting domain-containing protein [Bacteroidota bacterium]|nr:T9SS type A sorting domain-containing protein [Bacteroidota bacterium]